MKNTIAVAALGVGLALGWSSTSFADNVDGGAHPRSGVPNVTEHGANTARGHSRGGTAGYSGTDDSFATGDHMKQNHVSKHRRKKHKK